MDGSIGGDIGQIIVLANSAARVIDMHDVVAIVSETGRWPPCHQVAFTSFSLFDADLRFTGRRKMSAWVLADLNVKTRRVSRLRLVVSLALRKRYGAPSRVARRLPMTCRADV